MTTVIKLILKNLTNKALSDGPVGTYIRHGLTIFGTWLVSRGIDNAVVTPFLELLFQVIVGGISIAISLWLSSLNKQGKVSIDKLV